MSMNIPNDPIGNQTNKFQACSTVRQLTATPRHPPLSVGYLLFLCVMLEYLLHSFRIHISSCSRYILHWSILIRQFLINQMPHFIYYSTNIRTEYFKHAA